MMVKTIDTPDAKSLSIEEKQRKIKEYLNEVDKMNKKKRLRATIVTGVIIAILVCFVIKGIFVYREAQAANHTPVTIEDVTTSLSLKPAKRYDVSSRVTGDANIYTVEIDGNKSLWSKDEVKNLLTNDKIDTEIYELTCINNQKYKFDILIPDKITFRRYSVRGETPFTDEEITGYKQMAADYFTYRKYMRFGYDDAFYYDNPEVDDSNVFKDSILTKTPKEVQ